MKDYYLEFSELNPSTNERRQQFKTELHSKMYKAAPLKDFLNGEYTNWDSHNEDLCLLSSKYKEYELTLTIIDKGQVCTKCYMDGHLVAEFDSAILKRMGYLRQFNKKWYAIPYDLLDKFEAMKEFNAIFDFYEVDPTTLKVVCP